MFVKTHCQRDPLCQTIQYVPNLKGVPKKLHAYFSMFSLNIFGKFITTYWQIKVACFYHHHVNKVEAFFYTKISESLKTGLTLGKFMHVVGFFFPQSRIWLCINSIWPPFLCMQGFPFLNTTNNIALQWATCLKWTLASCIALRNTHF